MSDRRRPLRWLFWPSFLVSVALHIGAVVALLLLQDEKSGAVQQPTKAISVNIETTEVLQSEEQAPSATAVAGQTAPSPTEELKAEEKPEERSPEPELPTEKAADETKPVESDQPPPAPHPQPPEETAQERQQPGSEPAAERAREQLSEEALRKAQAEGAEKREAERRETERKEAEKKDAEHREAARREAERQEREAEAREKRERAEKRKAATEHKQKQQNAGASGSSGTRSSKARVSASQGAVRNYGGQVRACLNNNKPRSLGASGRVKIAIAISPSGGLASARIVSSSGNSKLDQAAVATARRCSPFPPPPAGSSDGQRRFTIPFTFD